MMFNALMRAPEYFFNTNSIGMLFVRAHVMKILYLLLLFVCIVYLYYFFLLLISIGRILNRFSKDTSVVDDMLAFQFFDFFQVTSRT